MSTVLCLAVFIAGCTEGPLEIENGAPGEASDGNDATEELVNETTQNATNEVPLWAAWSECTGFFTSFIWVGEHDRFNAPPEWNYSSLTGQPMTGLGLYGLDCPRVSWGPFERPMKMVLDTAGVNGVPDACQRENANIGYATLQGIWVDDQEVVAWLHDTYQMPIYYASIEVSNRTLGGDYSIYSWEMTHDDGRTSALETTDDGDYRTYSELVRMFWFHNTTTSYMDWQRESIEGNGHVTSGHVEPPLSMADWHTDYASFGVTLQELDADADIARYDDMLCEEPRSP